MTICPTCNKSGYVIVISYEEALVTDAMSKMTGRKFKPIKRREVCPDCNGSGRL